ncbi:hypothetical protein HPB47_020662 [Ixodes persulcatus]|uniref:Uncharacterized protein n=1 Tax=Ixodes persulcatus TaxID=34615 RepID=A0AC60QEM7_IXOPE|nr:hypothetical protein HPB47_020662 [Ixodes persulcatus]
MILSTHSSTSIEDVKQAAPEGICWFQVQIFRDRDLTRNLVSRAERAGYRAIVLTADMPVTGNHVVKRQKGCSMPEEIRFANFEGILEYGYTVPNSPLFRKQGLIDPSQTWDDVSWLRSITQLPVILKGINTGAHKLDNLASTAAALRGCSCVVKRGTGFVAGDEVGGWGGVAAGHERGGGGGGRGVFRWATCGLGYWGGRGRGGGGCYGGYRPGCR